MGVVKDFIIRFRPDLKPLNQGFDQAHRNTQQFGRKFKNETGAMRRNVERDVNQINRSFRSLAGGAILGFGIRKFAEWDGAMQTALAKMPRLSGAVRQEFEAHARNIEKLTNLSRIQGVELGGVLHGVTRDMKVVNATMETSGMLQSRMRLSTAEMGTVFDNTWKGFGLQAATSEERTRRLLDVQEDLYAASQGNAQAQALYNQAISTNDPLVFAAVMEQINAYMGDYTSTLKQDSIEESKSFSATIKDLGHNLATAGSVVGEVLLPPLRVLGKILGTVADVAGHPALKWLLTPIVWTAAAMLIWRAVSAVTGLAAAWNGVAGAAGRAAVAQRAATAAGAQSTLGRFGMVGAGGTAAKAGAMGAGTAALAVAGGAFLGQSAVQGLQDTGALDSLAKFAQGDGPSKNKRRFGKIATMGLTPLMAIGAISTGLAGHGTVGGNLNEIGHAWNLKKFAEGGIVNRPTPGLVGEAGPEAVIPLKRGAAAGLLGGGGGININFNGTVYMRDRQESEAVLSDMSRSLYTMLAAGGA